MSYKALYRKYRPQSFSQVVGQASITKTLQNAIISGKISHAYLFCGPRGTGKTTVARIFAKALNCENPNNGEPCLNCTNCKEISESMSPDVVEIDAASNNGVDEIRDIREKVKFLPSGAKYKIYIIDEVHMLSTGAFNALLKTLEEPPKHVVFILATTEPQKLPATIISRCQRFDFKPLGTYEISLQLKGVCEKEEAAITEDAINAIAEAAEGGMRDALSILDQVISYGNKDINIEDVNTITGTISFDKMNLLMNYIEAKNINFALETINDFIYSGKEASKIISAMLVYCRDILLYISVGSKNTNKYIFEKEKFQELALRIPTNKILYYIDVLCDVQNKIKTSTTPTVYLEIAIIKMCNVTDSQIDVLKRMNDLEAKIESGEYAREPGDVNGAVDNEKLGMLDAKINQVVTEFNKLELHKLASRIDDVAQIVANRLNSEENINPSDNIEFKREFDNLKLEVVKLKNDALVENNFNDKISDLENEIQGLKNNSQGNNNYSSDIQALKQEINSIKNNLRSSQSAINIEEYEDKVNKVIVELNRIKENNNLEGENNNKIISLQNEIDALKDYITSIDFSKNAYSEEGSIDNNLYLAQIQSLKQDIYNLKSKIGDIKEESNKDYQEEINALTRKVNGIYSDIDLLKQNGLDGKDGSFDLSEIKEKLETLESRMYKFISSSISVSKEKSKPQQKKPNGQIMLFGDEIMSVDDIDKTKENVDFDKLEKEEADVEHNEAVQTSLFEEDKENEENIEVIKEAETKEEAIEDEPLKEDNTVTEEKENLFAFENSIKQDANEEVSEEKKESTELFNFEKEEKEIKEDVKKDSLEEMVEKPKVKDVVVDQYYDSSKGESVINKVNSSLVIKDEKEENRETILQDTIESVLRHESDRMYPNQAVSKEPQAEIIVGKQEERGDKFAKYDIKDVEQILYDSRQTDARNDRPRVLEIWKNLSRGIQFDLVPLAEMLQEAQVAVVGNRELVITYPNVSLCNQVMRSKFKREALKVIYSKLGDTYNYIALPFDVWQEKRQEYIKQYQIGISRPKLTKFDIPGLNVIEQEQEYVNREEKVINKAIEFFGDDIVKIE